MRYTAFTLFFVLTFFVIAPVYAQEPQFAPVPDDLSYDLERALKRAMEENRYIKAAQSDIMASEAGENRSRSELLPHAYATMDVSRLDSLLDDERNSDYLDQLSNTRRLGIRQTLFNMPAFSRYESASLQAERSGLYLQHVELEILYTTEREFFAYLSAVENVKSYQKAVERMKKQVQSAKAFYEKQMKPRLHVLQMQTQLAKEESRLSEAENLVETQEAKLISILSLPQECDVQFQGNLETTRIRALKELRHYITQALKERPDVLVHKKDVEISEERENVVWGEFLPEISGSADYNQKEIAYDNNSYPNRTHEYYTLGLNFRWNFFDSGSSYYGVKEQEQRTQSTKYKLEKLMEDVVAQVKESYLDVKQLEKQIYLSKAYVKEAQETYDRADRRYKLGIGTSTELVDASRELIEAEVSLNRALADYNAALAALYYSSGGDEELKLLGG